MSKRIAGRWLGVGAGIPVLAVAAMLSTQHEGISAERVDDPVVVERDDDAVTFTRDVARILQENCQICHQPGSLGPMTLMSYEEVRPWAPMIREAVLTQRMPPYAYDRDVGIQELQDDWRLTEEEIRTIVNWVDAGTPLGDLADMPEPVEWPDASQWGYAAQFGPPDVVIPSEPFTVTAEGGDVWWRPVVPSGITENRCIRAIETKPRIEGRAVTHHANTTFRAPGDDSDVPDDGDDSASQSGRLSEYALGKIGELIPEGACRRAPAGADVAWDIHYYPMGEEVVDHIVEVGVWFYPEDYEGTYRQTLSLYGLQGDIDLAPHGTAMTQGFHSFGHPVRIDSFQPHGHLRLVAKSLEIFYPETGRREMVSMVSNWSALWHHSHVYEEHVAPLVPAGAVLVITAWYDNTANNPLNPDPDVWVGRGSRTTDEMSHAWIALTHLDEEGYERLVAEREARERLTSEDNDNE